MSEYDKVNQHLHWLYGRSDLILKELRELRDLIEDKVELSRRLRVYEEPVKRVVVEVKVKDDR